MTDGAAVVAHREFEWRAGIVMPRLVGIDPVPVRALTRLQQKKDRGAGAATTLSVDTSRSERLAEVTTLGMRLQPEVGNDLVSRHVNQAGGGTVAFIDGVLPKAVNHFASFGRLARQSWLPKRKSR